MSKFKQLIVLFLSSVMLCMVSCTAVEKQHITSFTKDILSEVEPIDTIEIKKSYHHYEGEDPIYEYYCMYLFKEMRDFSSVYPTKNFTEKTYKFYGKYDSFGLEAVYKNYMFFHMIENGREYITRYNMDDNSEEIVFVYEGEYEISVCAANNDYIIWKEDENANWLKVSLNCYNINTRENKKIFTYSRDEKTDRMYSWNFNDIVLAGHDVYFDNTERIFDGKPDINLYRYDIENGTLHTIDEKRAAVPQLFNNLSWLSFDETTEEYILKNINGDPDITLGEEYIDIHSSENILVGHTVGNTNGIICFDGKECYPIIESTAPIDQVSCSEKYITWDGWMHVPPIYYDIEKGELIRVDILDDDVQYTGFVTDEYIIFRKMKFIPDLTLGGGQVIADTVTFDYIKISDLNSDM